VAVVSPRPAPPPTPSIPPPAPPAAPATTKPRPPPPALENRPKKRRNKAWFEEIFDEDYLRTLPFLTPKQTQREAGFLIEALGLKPGQQVLDIGCGYGRHAMEIAARGHNVVALDLSLPLLLRGADEAQRRGLSINFVHGDMRELAYEAQFDGAYCMFSTFGFFDDDTNKRAAALFARALKPGGRLVLDLLNRDYVIADLPTRVWWEGDGCVVLEEVDFNYFTSRVVSTRSIVFDDGRQIEQEISLRAYSLHEVGKLLHGAGFRVLSVSGGLAARGRFFGKDLRQIIVVAERRDPDRTEKGRDSQAPAPNDAEKLQSDPGP
jgi:ubiquinone/menaquinone biosynthesis C-methylase UbiE